MSRIISYHWYTYFILWTIGWIACSSCTLSWLTPRTSFIQFVAGSSTPGPCLSGVNLYGLTDQFQPSPLTDITAIPSPTGVLQLYQSSLVQNWNATGGPILIEIPKATRRIVLKVVFNETDCMNTDGTPYGPLILSDGMTGSIIHSGTLFTLPYELAPTFNNVSTTYSFDTAQGSLIFQFLVNGVSYMDSSNHTMVVVPGVPVRGPIRLEGTVPTNAPMTFDLTITGGAHIDQTQVTFTAGTSFISAHPPQLIFSAPYTGVQAQTVLITGRRNYTVSPLNQADEDRYGSSFVLPVQVVPNGVCKADGGHIVFGGATNGSPIQWNNSVSTFTSTTSTCWWWKPEISNERTQVWLSFGPDPIELEYGIFGSDSAASGQPSGAIFMRNRVLNNVTVATPPGWSTSNPGASFNWHIWQHVCFINHNDGTNSPHLHWTQIYINGLPATPPTSFAASWTVSYGQGNVTIGSRHSGTLPANGALDELYIYMRSLFDFEILNSYQTGSWASTTTAGNPYYFSFDGQLPNYTFPLGPYVSWSLADKVCTAIPPMIGTMNNVSGLPCLEPFTYGNFAPGVGINAVQNGKLGIALDGNVMTGGSDMKGPMSVDFMNNAFYVCTWVNRYQRLINTQQTIFSLGTTFQDGAGILSLSYYNTAIRVNFGVERSQDNIDIPLNYDSDGTYSSDDHRQWIHWCITVSPPNSDYEYQPRPYFQLYRNGRWWFRSDLSAAFQNTTLIPVNATSDNFICLGCLLNDTDVSQRYVLMGALDEFHLAALPSFGGLGGFDKIITTSFRTDTWTYFVSPNGDRLWYKFTETTGNRVGAYIYDSISFIHQYPNYLYNYTLNALPNFLGGSYFSSPVGLTCLTIGQPFYQDPTVPALGNVLSYQLDSLHPFSHNRTGTTEIEWIEMNPSTRTLTLSTHSQTFANHDFSVCYWTRRDPIVNDFTSNSWTHYDVSIGNPSMWIGSHADNNTEYYVFSLGNFATMLLVPAGYTQHSSLDQSMWVQICGTYASVAQHPITGAVRKLYRNGQLLGEDFPTADLTSNVPITIGVSADGTLGNSINHQYDDVMIFTSTLTTADIVNYFNRQLTPTTPPVFRWTFDMASLVAGGTVGYKSVVSVDVILCTGTGPCGYQSWLGSTASEAANAPNIQLLQPMVCPLDYYSDGALYITQSNWSPFTGIVSGNSSSGPLIITSPPGGVSSPFYDTDFGFSLWVKLSEPSPPYTQVHTIFEFGCNDDSTNKLWIDPSGTTYTIAFSVGSLTVNTASSPKDFGRVGVWTQIVGSYSWASGGILRLSTSFTDTFSIMDPVTNHRLNCANGVNATLGSFFSFTNFNGFIDEFKVYNNLVDLTTSDGAFRFSMYDPSGNYMQRVNAIHQAQHLQLYLNFAEQQGQLIHSTHTITAASNITWTVRLLVAAAEPAWYSPGITTYFQAAYETDASHSLLATGFIPASEGSIPCTQVTLESPITIQSKTITQYGGLPTGMSAMVNFSWLQIVGPQGLTVTIDAPAGVTVLPNQFIYPPGSGGYLNSLLPSTFNVTSMVHQFVTLTFRFSGPEAVHFRPYLNRLPVYTFTAYADLTVDFYCYFRYYDDLTGLQMTANTTEAFPYQTDVFNSASTSSLFFQGNQTQLNTCGFKITRFNSALAETAYIVRPDGSTLSSPAGGFSVWQSEFPVPIGTFNASVLSPFDGQKTLTISRVKGNPIPVNVSSPPCTQGQPCTITVVVPNRFYNNFTIFPILSDPAVTITPSSITLIGPNATVTFTMTIPIQHPAFTSVNLTFNATGLGADEIMKPPPINLLNSYQLTGDNLISAAFILPSGHQVNVPLLGSATSSVAAYDVSLQLSDTGVNIDLLFDQPLLSLGYLLIPLSSNFTLPSNTSAAVDFQHPTGTHLNFYLPNLPVGSHVLFMHSKSVDNSNGQLFVFNLTIESPIIAAQLICDSPSQPSRPADNIALDLSLNSFQSIQLNNYACLIYLVAWTPTESTITILMDQTVKVQYGLNSASLTPSSFQLVNGVSAMMELLLSSNDAYTFNLTSFDNSVPSSTGTQGTSSSSGGSNTGASSTSTSSTSVSSTGVSSTSVSSTGVSNTGSGPIAIPTPPVVVNGTCQGSDNPCLYGSECIPADTSAASGNKTFTPTCICAPQFRGPLCQFAILSCPDCVVPAPPSNHSAPTVWTNLTFVGLGFDRIASITVGAYQVDPAEFARFESIYRNHSLVQNALAVNTFDPDVYQLNAGFYLIQLRVDVSKVGNISTQAHSQQAWIQSRRTSKDRHSNKMFISATGSSGFVPVTFELILSAPTEVSYPVLVYQSIYSTCLAAGQWKPDPNNGNQCLSCPQGGYCPGGGLVYPEPGYWSANEYTAPIACELGVDQCPGTNVATLSTLDNTGHVDTQVCGPGYVGQACGSCDTDYYQSSKQCFRCSSSASESAQLAGLLLLGLAVLGFLSLAVAIASSESLATIVSLFVLLQQTIATGKNSSQTWPKSLKSLSDLFNTLGIINFDLTFLKPGCIAPTYSFIDTFYGTLLFAAIAFIMFQVACWLRKRWLLLHISRSSTRSRAADEELYGHTDLRVKEIQSDIQAKLALEEKKEHEIELEYKRRIRHATLILGSLFFLKLTTLELNGLNCHQVPRSTTLDATSDASSVDPNDMIYVLMSDPTTQCWVGTHAGTAVIIVFLLIVFSFGFPYYCMVVLTRAFAPIVLMNHSSSWLGRLLLALGYARIHTSTSGSNSFERLPGLENQKLPDTKVEESEEKQLQKLYRIHMELFGYLFRGVKNERYFFRLLSFPISLGFTLTLVFVSDVVERTFILGLLYSFNSVIHCFLIPFTVWRANVISSGIQLASLVYTIGVLALMKGDMVNTYTMTLGFVAIVAGIQYLIFIVFKRGLSSSLYADNKVTKLESDDSGGFDEDPSAIAVQDQLAPPNKEIELIREPSQQRPVVEEPEGDLPGMTLPSPSDSNGQHLSPVSPSIRLHITEADIQRQVEIELERLRQLDDQHLLETKDGHDEDTQAITSDLDHVLDGALTAEDSNATTSLDPPSSSIRLTAALMTLRFTSTKLLAARLKQLKETLAKVGDVDSVESKAIQEEINHFERLYRELVTNTAATTAHLTRSLSAADEALLHKLSQGKTTKQAKLIEAAFNDAAMLELFHLDERKKQEEIMQMKLQRRQQKHPQQNEEDPIVITSELDHLLSDTLNAFEHHTEATINSPPSDPSHSSTLSATMIALRFAGARLLAAKLRKLKATQATVTDAVVAQSIQLEIDHFERLYRELVTNTIATHDHLTNSVSAADQALQEKLLKGKTSKHAKVIEAALKDAALLELFHLDERHKQEEMMQLKLQRRQQKKAEVEEQRRKEIEHKIRQQGTI